MDVCKLQKVIEKGRKKDKANEAKVNLIISENHLNLFAWAVRGWWSGWIRGWIRCRATSTDGTAAAPTGTEAARTHDCDATHLKQHKSQPGGSQEATLIGCVTPSMCQKWRVKACQKVL